VKSASLMNRLRAKYCSLNEKPGAVFLVAFFSSIFIHVFILLFRGCAWYSPEQVHLESVKAKFTLINLQAFSDNINKEQPSERSSRDHSESLLTGTDGRNNSSADVLEQAASLSDTDSIEKKSYESEVLKRIHRMKYYPEYAKRMGLEGRVTLKFTVFKNGILGSSPEVIRGCAHDILNRAGIITVSHSSPFPPFPADIADQDESITFFVTIDYSFQNL